MIYRDRSRTMCTAGTSRGARPAMKALVGFVVIVVATLGLAAIGHADTLQVTKQGTGSGVVTANVGSLSCGTSCTATVSNATLVTLTARASAGSRFLRWDGACASSATTCAVTVTGTVAVTAVFRQADIDFNGDGLADVAIHRPGQGDWFVGLSTGTSFNIIRFAVSLGNRGRDRERIFLGDFTGDGRTDVAIHDHATGDWFVGRSTGTEFVVARWATGFGNRGQNAENVLVGDFNGDGLADVAIHDRGTGDWFVGLSTGTEFAFTRWLTGFGNRGTGRESVFVGDFTGDGRTDVAIHDRQTGAWWIGRSTGTSFALEPWASNFGTGGQAERIFIGDFTGDGRVDVAVQDTRSGNWWVGRSTGAGFAIEPWVSGFGTLGAAEDIVAGSR